jgi:hypothetical protein
MVNWCFGESFDLYATPSDALAGYWDSGSNAFTLNPGRFAGSRCWGVGTSNVVILLKNSGSNDAIHHIICAYQQTSALSGTTLGTYLQLSDGATPQCSIGFRQDGALVLTSGAIGGTVLDTYVGAVTAVNQWVAFEIEVVINNTTGSWAVRRNGNTSNDHALGSLNTRPTSANNYANRFGIGVNATSVGTFLDDVFWRSDAASVPWIGDVRCYTRMPARDVAVQFTPPSATLPQTPIAASGAGSVAANSARYEPFTAPCSGTIGAVTLPITVASTANFKCAIFASAGNVPTTVLGSATPITAPGVGTATFTFATPVPVAQGTQYWVGYNSDSSSGSYSQAASSSSGWLSGNTTYPAWPVSNPPGLSGASAPCFTLIITPTGGTNYAFVSEPQQDGSNTYVSDATAGDTDLYGLAPFVTPPLVSFATTVRSLMQKSDAGSRNAAAVLKSGATQVSTPAAPALTTWNWSWRTDQVDPNTGNPWTAAAVDAVQIGQTVVS